MKVGVLLAEARNDTRSDNELRRFLRGGPETFPSPMVVRGELVSKAKAPRTVGRSLDTGRLGEPGLTSNIFPDAFEKLDICESGSLVLLRVRQTEMPSGSSFSP